MSKLLENNFVATCALLNKKTKAIKHSAVETVDNATEFANLAGDFLTAKWKSELVPVVSVSFEEPQFFQESHFFLNPIDFAKRMSLLNLNSITDGSPTCCRTMLFKADVDACDSGILVSKKYAAGNILEKVTYEFDEMEEVTTAFSNISRHVGFAAITEEVVAHDDICAYELTSVIALEIVRLMRESVVGWNFSTKDWRAMFLQADFDSAVSSCLAAYKKFIKSKVRTKTLKEKEDRK